MTAANIPVIAMSYSIWPLRNFFLVAVFLTINLLAVQLCSDADFADERVQFTFESLGDDGAHEAGECQLQGQTW